MRSSNVVKILFCVLLIFITPMRAEKLSVTLTTAGTLSTRLQGTDNGEVTELKLSGPINGSDINEINRLFLICQMPKFQAEEIVTMGALACIYIIQAKRTAIKK